MKMYEAKDVVRLAKRYNNRKRNYLLINPLQGKHMPVSPSASLEMMESLGEKLRQRFPEARLVIGFAETATAIGAAVAGCISADCRYLHTTREEVEGVKDWICFQEEHSHAVEQKLCGDSLRAWICATPQVIFVDDELTTGKTLINILTRLRSVFPELEGKALVAASVINRLSPQNEARLLEAGAVCEWLVKLPEGDCAASAARFEAGPAEDCRTAAPAHIQSLALPMAGDSPRTGVVIGQYLQNCRALAQRALPWLRERLRASGRVLVLGTEECMYPSLLLAQTLEEQGIAEAVSFHATTRSPIAICEDSDYPIFNGYCLNSFYQTGRDTYVYNLRDYDAAIVWTDAAGSRSGAIRSLSAALNRQGCSEVLFLSGGGYV